MSDLTLRYDIDGATTRMTVEGSVDACQCRTLRDGLEMARGLRAAGPIIVDVGGADRLAAVALLILRRAADDARRAGRTLTVCNLRLETVHDPRSVRLFRSLWSDQPDGPTFPAPETGRRHARRRRGSPAVATAR